MANMIVSMLLRLVDEFAGPLAKDQAAVDSFAGAAERASQASVAGAQRAARAYAEERAQIRETAAAETELGAKLRAGFMHHRFGIGDAPAGSAERKKAIKEEAEAARELDHAYAGVAKQMAGMAAAYAGLKLAKDAIKAGAEGVHSAVGMETSGVGPGEIKEIQQAAADLSRTYRMFSQTSIEHMAADARAILGDTHHAIDFLPELLKMRTILAARNPKGDHEKDFNDLLKGFEVAGYARDPERLRHVMDIAMKSMNAFAHTLDPAKYGEFFRYAGPAAAGFNDQFLKRALPTLLSEQAGSTVGQQIATLASMVVGGHMTPAAAKAFAELGLVKEGGADLDKKGAVKHVRPGGIVGEDIFKQDPAKWMSDVVVPAARAKGLSEEKINDLLYTLFPNRNAQRMAFKSSAQEAQMDKDERLVNAAPGMEAWQTWMNKDPGAAWTGVAEQFGNTLRASTEPFQGASTNFANAVSQFVGSFNQRNAEHPWMAPTAVAAGLAATAWAGVKAWTAASSAAKVSSWAEVIGGAIGKPIGLLARLTPWLGIAYESARAGAEILKGGIKGPMAPGQTISPANLAKQIVGPEGGAPAPVAYVAPNTLGDAARPKVDMSEVDAAKDQAAAAGADIKQSLGVTAAPQVDTSSIDAAIAKMREFLGLIGQAGAQMRALPAGAGAAARKSPGALHDGYETEGR